ncbi:hypothetical protein AC579_4770 [Pseudocercospora musae]|uniref:Uncharacterized protein n=1 Tax=Pseudocercospora musae TaxID=113226 RepID=A0A139IQU0_9PEZI|nr:hypothetical protein AC579_4770 [Pseudocercospora musae]
MWAQDFTKKRLRQPSFAQGNSAGFDLDVKNFQGIRKFVLADLDDALQHRQLCGLLQVPEIPRWAKDLAFCYAVRTQWAYGKIFAVLQGRSTFTALEFAAIKEENFLALDVDRFRLTEEG